MSKASFSIIGRIGSITPLSNVLKLSIFSGKTKNDKSIVNQITVFNENTIDYILKSCAVGALVSVDGTINQNSYTKDDGSVVYDVTLAAHDFSKLAAPKQKQ